MLVYANHLNFTGNESFISVLGSMCKWIKYETGKQIKPYELTNNSSFRIKDMWVETIKADLNEPYLFSVTFSYPDKRISGRQWCIETGIKVNSDSTEVSCTQTINDMSCLVAGEIRLEMPRFLQFILAGNKLSTTSTGLSLKSAVQHPDYLSALLYEIERTERDYSMILVSPTPQGKYLVDADFLQQQIIGLGQVIKIEPSFDTFLMERVMGKNFSAWNGAINVIETPFSNGHVRNKLFRPEDIQENPNTDSKRINKVCNDLSCQVIAAVTHNTNVPMMRKHIKPNGVKAKSLKETYTRKSTSIDEGMTLSAC